MGELVRATAYGSQVGNEAEEFIGCLRRIGFDTKYQQNRVLQQGERKEVIRANWNVGISMDVVRVVTRGVDTVILGTANMELMPLIQWVRDQGVRAVVYASGVQRDMRDLVDQFIEIDSELLEEPREVAA
jgi:uncharacterized LabA/DUF88 family protein